MLRSCFKHPEVCSTEPKSWCMQAAMHTAHDTVPLLPNEPAGPHTEEAVCAAPLQHLLLPGSGKATQKRRARLNRRARGACAPRPPAGGGAEYSGTAVSSVTARRAASSTRARLAGSPGASPGAGPARAAGRHRPHALPAWPGVWRMLIAMVQRMARTSPQRSPPQGAAGSAGARRRPKRRTQRPPQCRGRALGTLPKPGAPFPSAGGAAPGAPGKRSGTRCSAPDSTRAAAASSASPAGGCGGCGGGAREPALRSATARDAPPHCGRAPFPHQAGDRETQAWNISSTLSCCAACGAACGAETMQQRAYGYLSALALPLQAHEAHRSNCARAAGRGGGGRGGGGAPLRQRVQRGQHAARIQRIVARHLERTRRVAACAARLELAQRPVRVQAVRVRGRRERQARDAGVRGAQPGARRSPGAVGSAWQSQD